MAEVAVDEDYGFLTTKEGGLLYFHRNAALGGNDEVYYVAGAGDTGPIAIKVRAKTSRESDASEERPILVMERRQEARPPIIAPRR